MEYLLGFLIGTAVGLTGVGAGSLTAPILILFFGLTPQQSVGTALAFAAIIKLAVAPLYFFRRQVHLRTFLLMCGGGIPGVIAGYFAIQAFSARQYQTGILLTLGLTIASLATYSLYRATRQSHAQTQTDHSGWLPLISAGIGAEVGFSSAGAGALGSVVLLNLTRLTPAEVVGTDMLFGLVVSLVGGGFHLCQGFPEQLGGLFLSTAASQVLVLRRVLRAVIQVIPLELAVRAPREHSADRSDQLERGPVIDRWKITAHDLIERHAEHRLRDAIGADARDVAESGLQRNR